MLIMHKTALCRKVFRVLTFRKPWSASIGTKWNAELGLDAAARAHKPGRDLGSALHRTKMLVWETQAIRQASLRGAHPH